MAGMMEAGAATGNPYLAAAGAAVDLFSSSTSQAAPAGPSLSNADAFNPWSQGDWTVATSGSKATAAGGASWMQWAALAIVAALVLWKR
jgi:hypothetical protein